MALTMVVLPESFGPTRPKISPFSMSNVIFFSALRPPNDRSRSRHSKIIWRRLAWKLPPRAQYCFALYIRTLLGVLYARGFRRAIAVRCRFFMLRKVAVL